MRSTACPVVLGLLLAATPGGAAVIRVHRGHSIQAAVDAASPGDHILVYPGTYHEAGTPCPTDAAHRCAVVVTKDNIKLIALSHNRFEHNTVTGNGLAPDPTYTSLAADLIDVPGASDAGECWKDNTFTSQFPGPPFVFPACP